MRNKQVRYGEIPIDEVNLTPALIPDVARQVIEKSKRIVDEDEIARKAGKRKIVP